MGYLTKKELMEELTMENNFSDEELLLIDKYITVDRIYTDTKLDLNAITIFEKEGILSRFYEFCLKYTYFPKWIENVENGIDIIKR